MTTKKTPKKQNITVTVVLKKEKHKKSKAEMKKDKLEDQREMLVSKALISELKKKR